MWTRTRKLFTLRYSYENPVDHRQAISILYISLTFAVVLSFWLVFFLQTAGDGSGINVDPFTMSLMLGSPVLFISLYLLVQTGRLRAASWLFSLFLIVLTLPPLADGLDSALVAAPILSMISALLLLGRRGIAVAGLVAVIGLFGGALVQSGATEAVTVVRADNVGFDLPATLTMYALVAIVLFAFGGNIQRVIARAIRQIKFTRQIIDFSTEAGTRTESDIYNAAITLLRDGMGYPFAQIYLADDRAALTRRVRSGSAHGDEGLLVAVEVGPASSLQNAASLRETVIVSQFDRENRRPHLLPSMTHSVSVPILLPATDADDNERPDLLGVLDVQMQTDVIDESDLSILEALALQIGTTIHLRRHLNALDDTLTEQNAIIESLRRQLRSARQAEIGLTGSAWDRYLTGRQRAAVGFDFDHASGVLSPAGDQPSALKAVMDSRRATVSEAQDGSYSIEVPIMLNEEVLGAMAFSVPHRPDDGQVQMATAVAGRLALALENKRLFEQSQAAASRERKASDATSLLISANDVQAVMKLAADSFNRALGAVHTRIEIDPNLAPGEPVANGSGPEPPAYGPPAAHGEGDFA